MSSQLLLKYKEFINPSSSTSAWETLVLETSYWSKLVEHNFHEEPLKHFFESLDKEECKIYFNFGIACISCFIQANFTGPGLPKDYGDFFSGSLFQFMDYTKLSPVDCQDINVNCRYPHLLYTAKCIFKNCNLDSTINIWWQWRCILIHQQVLDSLNPFLLTEAEDLHKHIQTFQLEDDIKAELEIEQVQLYNLFRQILKSEMHMNVARRLLHIEYELIGKMGKRTKFQQTEVAQLALTVKTKDNSNIDSIQVVHEIPQNISLQDDVMLDHIQFANSEVPVPNLSILDQKLLLTALQLMLISQPQDNLYYEEVKPFIDLLLQQNNTWSIRVVILLIRCKFDAKHKRTIERCLMQCEEIVNAIKKEVPIAYYRVYDIYGTSIPPIWKIEELLGNLMLSLGLAKAALDIFLKLQNWEAVITCYTLLKLRHKAAEVIQQQLDRKPSVKLLCHLGDATDDITYYERAWERSEHTSFLAQYHWGLFCYQVKQYQDCILHLEKSVSLNPLQPSAWLYLGYASLETENWESAAAAYRYYTSLEPGSFEIWNNLAKAYIKLGNKRAAHQALHDALRCNYDNWKVWDNLMGVSADIGHFSDIIRSYHRILDLKEKHLDLEVLTVLVSAVCSDINDSDGNLASRLLQKTRELLGRITSIYPADGRLWELYAMLAPDSYIKAQRLQRALRGFMNPEWEKSPEKCLQVLYICRKLAESALSCEIDPTNSILNSIKLSLKSVISIIKKFDYIETCASINVLDEHIQELLKKIEDGRVKLN